ncbi:MAG: histidinol-phosphate transaminase [Oscillospiraceae bacterium]|nr:histidinol-phosphate transaminase [Oscillospiraceae bacterium]
MDFTVSDMKNLVAYTPGEQPRDMDYIKLNTNELPYPPSPDVIKALSDFNPRLYPDPASGKLKAAIAEYYNLRKENIFVSAGSDEALSFAFRAFIAGEKVFFADITYDFYRVFSAYYNAAATMIPLSENFRINVSDYHIAGDNSTIIIANPNAPTGLYLSNNEIEELLLQNPRRLVIIDEAYIDFGGNSALGLTNKYNNLLIMRTFSKSRGLAGLRLGFAAGASPLIEALEKVKYSCNPYNVNMAAQLAGTAAICDDLYFQKTVKAVTNTREKLKENLIAMGAKVTDSMANFVFASFPGINGGEIYSKLKKRGVLVRYFDKPRIREYVRITIGTEAEIDSLVEICANEFF